MTAYPLVLKRRGENMTKPISRRRRIARWLTPIIFIPFIAVLWVPFYNQLEPELWGIPYFYWYQLGCIPLSAVLIYIVYLVGER